MLAPKAMVITIGDSQVVLLPRELVLDGDEVFISRSGDSLILTSRMTSWKGLVEGLSGFSDDFAT